MLVSVLALVIVSSSSLFVYGNNKHIDNIKTDTESIHKKITQDNHLTKTQIMALINNVNHNDAQITAQHKEIKKTVKNTELESKVRTGDMDSRLRSFKNITNANAVGMTDKMKTNDSIVHKRVDTVKQKFDDYKILTDSELNTTKFNHDKLSDSHSTLQTDFGIYQSTNGSRLKDNRDYTTSLYNSNLDLINNKISGLFESNKDGLKAGMDKVSDSLMKTYTKNVDSKFDTLQSGYRYDDDKLRTDMKKQDDENTKNFLFKTDLDTALNDRYFATDPLYKSGMNSLINQTTMNTKNVAKINTTISDNEQKIKNIKEDYLKKAELPIKVNEIMPTTDIYKNVMSNKTQMDSLDKEVRKNINTIEANNAELKEMLTNIRGGMNGEITLKDLNDQIQKNAKRIETDASKNKADILRSVNKDTAEIQKKVTSNSLDLTKKIGNNENEYAKAFNTYVSDEMITNKLKGKPIDINEIKANNATLSGDLVVGGIKFSDIAKTVNKNSAGPGKASYEGDFQSGPYIRPLKSMQFKDTNIDMDQGNMSMKWGDMSIQDGNFFWSKNGSKINFTENKANFNKNVVEVDDFANIKDKNNTDITKLMDDKISFAQKKEMGGTDNMIRDYVNKSDLTPNALITENLFIKDGYSSKIDVKQKLKGLDDQIANASKSSAVRQNAAFYKKNNKDDLFSDISADMNKNVSRYLPRNLDLKGSKVSAYSLQADELILSANTLDKIKLNKTVPLTNYLDNRYVTKSDYKNTDSNKLKPITQIELTPNNSVKIMRSEDRMWTTVGRIKTEKNNSISKIALDQSNNRLIITGTNGITYLGLPPLSGYATKTEVSTLANKSYGDTNVVYLNPNQKKRLANMVDDDVIQNLKSKTFPTTNTVDTLKTGVKDNSDLIQKNKKAIQNNTSSIKNNAIGLDNIQKTLVPSMKGQVNLNNLNDQSKNDTSTINNHIRLNDSVSLKADGKRLQMCTRFDGNDNPIDCHDFWTTKDIEESKFDKYNIKK